jgi:extracellular factor (EF) 3-hydroxypalmitic acid methyl ester biosynthesis protein
LAAKLYLTPYPIARRSYQKPRGYDGDAVLLDYIYGILLPEPGDSVAEAIASFGAHRPAGQAVRRHRIILSQYMDAIAKSSGRPIRILSIASGHLRGAELSSAFASGAVAEFVALDSDAESCALVSENLPKQALRQAEVRQPQIYPHRASQ